MRTAKAAILFCLAVATGSGSWYLRVRVPDNQWRRTDEAGRKSMDQGRFGEADRQFVTAIEAARAFGDRDLRLARSLFHRAQALVAQAKHSDAVPLLEQALAIYEKALGQDHPDVARVREYYAALLRAAGRSADAEAAWWGSPREAST
ncbi:MAG: tetratricopeptide repeat protein [Isosphaerales bacterium]